MTKIVVLLFLLIFTCSSIAWLAWDRKQSRQRPKGNLYGHPWPPLYEVNKRLPNPPVGYAWELKVTADNGEFLMHLTLVNAGTGTDVDCRVVNLTIYRPHRTTWTKFYANFRAIGRERFEEYIVSPMIGWATQLVTKMTFGNSGTVEYMMGDSNG